MFYFKIFKLYNNYIFEKNNLTNVEDFNKNLKKRFIHLFNSNYLIVFSIKIFFIFLNLLSLIFRFQFIYNLKKNSCVKMIKIVSKILSFYTVKLDELIFAIIFIQNKEFNEKTNFLKIDNKTPASDIMYDAIVIGSGPSGSITANFLQKKFKNILLVDKGNAFQDYAKKHPGDEFLYKWHNSGINTTLYKNQVSFASGSCLGGGSEINSGLLHLPDDHFIREWKKDYNVKDLDTKKINDDLKKVLSEDVSIEVVKGEKQNYSAKVFLEAIKKNNFNHEELFKFESLKNGLIEKSTMTKTLISDYIKKKGCILLKFNVDKIFKNKNNWVVKGEKNRKEISFRAKNVFLCAGSIYTNQLLIQNKLVELKKANSFKFHPMIKVIAEYDKDMQNGKENVHNVQITEHYPDFLIGQAASSYQFLKYAAYKNSSLSKEVEKKWKKMLIYHATFSMGIGKIFPFFGKNKFIYTYDIGNENLKKIQNALNVTVNTLYESGATNIYFIGEKIHLIDKKNIKEQISLFSKIEDFKFSAVHILGGVKSGENKNCTTDSFGKIKKYENIYVNDSSLINHNLLKNPQGTVMAIAIRNIKKFLANV